MLTSTVFVAEVREADHVAEADALSHTRQHKLHGSAPVLALRDVVQLGLDGPPVHLHGGRGLPGYAATQGGQPAVHDQLHAFFLVVSVLLLLLLLVHGGGRRCEP